MFHTYCYSFKVTALFSFALLKWSSHTVKNIYQPPSQSPNASKHSLCLWGGSAASDLCEERFDCDRKRGLSTAGTWMTAKREGGVLERKHLMVADISMAITGCSCSTRWSWWNFSLAIPGCFTLPSQFQDLDLHCSCQNTSSSPADDKSHTLAREGIHWNIWCVLGWLYLTWSQYSKTRVNFLSLCKTSCSLEETEQL